MNNNVIVGQSGGPTAVINSSLAGVLKTAIDNGAEKVYGMCHGIQGLLDEKFVDLSEHIRSDVDIELLKRTPSAYLGSCRYKLPEIREDEDTYKRIFDCLNKLKIGYFFYIGGNDSMDAIKKLSYYADMIKSSIKFMGVPKTIDNDLAGTDHTPGYGSAAKYIGTALKEIVCDSLVYNQRSVTIVEIMGRNAGWLTGAAALARSVDCIGPDMIFLPEVVFDIEDFISKIQKVQEYKKSVVIAVSEGIKVSDGRYVCELESGVNPHVDAFGHKFLTGAGRTLADIVSERLGVKTRAIELNTLQRCSSHIVSAIDISEAFMVGGEAVRAAFNGDSGKMIIIKRVSDNPYQCVTDVMEIDKIANIEKKVPQEWIDIENSYVKKEFLDYVKPLIQMELTQVMSNGLPRHIERLCY